MNAAWLSWDFHRRSSELARALDIPFEVMARRPWPGGNALWPLLKTAARLVRARERVIIVQNPSLLLTTLACLLRPWRRWRLVQDLHSYFSLHVPQARGFRGRVYRRLSLFCLRRADVTIVTNEPLKRVVEEAGGRGFVLQDRLPDWPAPAARAKNGSAAAVFICTYSEDEPVHEVIEAAERLGPETRVFITGRVKNGFAENGAGSHLPSNVTLTGFLPEDRYRDLLSSADAVLALTTRDHTLLCGAYEAIALGRPLVMSDTDALRSYFRRGPVLVKNEPDALADGVRAAVNEGPRREAEIQALARDLRSDWNARFARFRAILAAWSGGERAS